jgi:hypothetical protein
MPAVDAATGRLLLAEKDELFVSPDGHGGTVAALAASGAIRHMHDRGIRHLFYLQVDNPLTPICDPELIGYHLAAESELTSIAVAKQGPHDKVGNFVSIDGRVQVIEYSDFPDDVAVRRTGDGSRVFWAGSIAVHVFAVSFLERALAMKEALPFHIARKKVPHLAERAQVRAVHLRPSATREQRDRRRIRGGRSLRAAQERTGGRARHGRVRPAVHDRSTSTLAHGGRGRGGRRRTGRDQPALGAGRRVCCRAPRPTNIHQSANLSLRKAMNLQSRQTK